MLLNLPSDILHDVIAQITTRRDLKHLCEVSSHLRNFVTPVLYRSIILKARDEYELCKIGPLPSTSGDLLHYVKDIQITSEFRYNDIERCPHISGDFSFRYEDELDEDDQMDEDYELNEDDQPDEDHGIDEVDEIDGEYEAFNDDDNDDDGNCRFYSELTKRLMPILHGCKDDTLQSFTWGLGTCIPQAVLGLSGYLTLRQTRIESIRLITDGACDMNLGSLCPIYLGGFKNLKRISWTGMRSFADFRTIYYALQQVSTQLLELELDLVDWYKVEESLIELDLSKSESEEDEPSDYVSRNMLPLPPGSDERIFPALRKLALSGIWLGDVGGRLAHAIDFTSLHSLKLHLCPGWNVFLEGIIQSNQQITLTSLEIQYYVGVETAAYASEIEGFLQAFQGLEKLYLSLMAPVSILNLWRSVLHHGETLQKFVCHLRNPVDDINIFHHDDTCDTPNLSLSPKDLSDIQQDPLKNPLNQLKPKLLGLCCVPELLKDILSPVTHRTNLQLLHIRQTGSDYCRETDWAVSLNLFKITPGQDVQTKLTNEVYDFAQWAFGPDGFPSLKLIAFGDFSYDVRFQHSFVLQRSEASEYERQHDGAGQNFRILKVDDQSFWDVVDKHSDFLAACSTELLFTD